MAAVLVGIGVAVVALLVIAWTALRMSRLHWELAEAYDLIARMLREPEKATRHADEYRRRKMAARR